MANTTSNSYFEVDPLYDINEDGDECITGYVATLYGLLKQDGRPEVVSKIFGGSRKDVLRSATHRWCPKGTA